MSKRDKFRRRLIAKLVVTAICMVAIVSVMLVGVSAGAIQRLKVSSIVNIPANAVLCDITCNVTGHINDSEVNSTYDQKVTEEMENIPSWEIGDLEFDGEGHKPIVITIRIRNNNTRNLDIAFLIPPDSDKVDMKYETGVNLKYDDLVLTEKEHSKNNNYDGITSTEDFRVLEKVSIVSYEYYEIKITMSVKDVRKDFSKIDRNFAVTMAVPGAQQ